LTSEGLCLILIPRREVTGMKKLFRGMVGVGIAMLFVAGSLMSAHAAPVTVRAVSAWAKSAQFETQQFVEFLDAIQKEAN
jgi:hypothetical protein